MAQADLLGRFDLFDDMEFVAEMPDRIAAVTATAVREAARRWLELSRFSLAVIQPKTAQATKTERVWSGKLSNGMKVVQGYLVRELEDVLVQALKTQMAAVLLGDEDFYSRLARAYGSATPDSVQAAAKKHLGLVRIVLVKGKKPAE